MVTQKNHLRETVLLSTHNIWLNWWLYDSKITILIENKCLFGPMIDRTNDQVPDSSIYQLSVCRRLLIWIKLFYVPISPAKIRKKFDQVNYIVAFLI